MNKGARHSIFIQNGIIFCMVLSCIALYDYKIVFLGTQIIAIIAIVFKRRCIIGKYTKNYLVWGLTFGSFALLSKMWAASNNHSLFSTVISFFQVLLIGFLVLNFYQETKNLYLVIIAYISGCLLLVVRFFGDIPISMWGMQSRFPKNSIFGGNAPAISLSFAAVLLLGMIWKKGKRINVYFRTIAVLLISIFIFVSLLMGTRKAVVIIISGIILIILFEADTIKKKMGGVLLVIIVLTGAYLFITKVPMIYNSIGYRLDSLLNGLNKTGNGDISYNSRSLFIKDAVNVWRHNPVFGVGQDGYRYKNSILNGFYSHNNYVEILANLGLIGFIIYYSFFVFLIKKTSKVIKREYLPFVLLIIVLITDYSRISYSSENCFLIISIIIIMMMDYEGSGGDKC